MLVLSRKPGEKVVLDGGVTVTILAVHGDRVRVGFDAPEQTRILRAELAVWQDDRLDFKLSERRDP